MTRDRNGATSSDPDPGRHRERADAPGEEGREGPVPPRLAEVVAAAERLRGLVHRTPVMTCRTLDRLAGRQLYFKCENLQRVGAFKIRGASNFIARLEPEVAARGVVTHSSGNHGQAVALAARQRQVPAWVVVPENAARVKLAAIAGYGGRVVPCEPTLEAREAAAARILAETGATFVPPYDHADIVAGQGTATLELLEEVPGLDAVVAPVGGGGLVSGAAVTARGIDERIRIFAAEPAGADDAARSLEAGRRIPQTAPDTLADGLRTGLGELNWSVIRTHVEQVLTVSEEQILAAMRRVWERMKLVIEPSAAVPVAAVLADPFRELDGLERVGLILSGGNVDLDRLGELLRRAAKRPG